MNFANVDWVGVLINWFPMLMIFAVWVFFMRGVLGNHQKKYRELAARQADALERIATALEKRH